MKDFVPIAHRKVVVDLIRKYRIRVFAEVGVNQGYMMRDVLRAVGGEMHEYWAIDIWKAYKASHTQDSWERIYKRVCLRMTYFPILRIVRMDSTEVTELFRDGYFDGVFLDTTHTYEDTLREIDAWLPKIKRGGIFAGHDYGARRKAHQGCKIAVDERFPNVKVYPHTVFVQEVT